MQPIGLLIKIRMEWGEYNSEVTNSGLAEYQIFI